MVSRQETARPLLTPGEVMQLPPDEEIVMVSGHPPDPRQKLRYFEDRNFTERVLPPPVLSSEALSRPASRARPDDWTRPRFAADPRRPARQSLRITGRASQTPAAASLPERSRRELADDGSPEAARRRAEPMRSCLARGRRRHRRRSRTQSPRQFEPQRAAGRARSGRRDSAVNRVA